jgi:hypothetical protein
MREESVTEKTSRMETFVYNVATGTVTFILCFRPYARWILPYGCNRTWI